MSRVLFPRFSLLLVVCALVAFAAASTLAEDATLKWQVTPKHMLTSLASQSGGDRIVFKLAEGLGQPELSGRSFVRTGAAWDELNSILSSNQLVELVKPRVELEKATLDRMRQEGSDRVGWQLPDLTLFYEIAVPNGLSEPNRRDIVYRLLSLDIVESAYFSPRAELASLEPTSDTPNWEDQQYHLKAAPTGIDAYYGWGFPGGHGEGVKVIDIEGNWNETHEDLHGGTDTWHIAGKLEKDPAWLNHGTAVLGEIAADSNDFGMTGISYNVDLGTVSIGSMSTSAAIATASANADPGDIILIELQRAGPHDGNYVALEFWADDFLAIVTASALGQIVVEAAANGNENYDDTTYYDSLFYPEHRFSGAIMVGASCADHTPASFTNYGRRVDVHGYGCWDVYTLGYGTLYGTSDDNNYTNSFSGTSSASPIIVGASAILQGIYKNNTGMTLDHSDLRDLLTTYSTPQVAHYKQIGPMPDLFGSCNSLTVSCCARRGDVDRNDQLNILDLDYLIDWLYKGGPEPSCMDEADADDSGQADVLDLDYLIDYLFRGGPQPLPCL